MTLVRLLCWFFLLLAKDVLEAVFFNNARLVVCERYLGDTQIVSIECFGGNVA